MAGLFVKPEIAANVARRAARGARIGAAVRATVVAAVGAVIDERDVRRFKRFELRGQIDSLGTAEARRGEQQPGRSE